MGSEFVVRLPETSLTEEADAPAAIAVSQQVMRRANASLRVLVVDDSVDGAKMLAAALREKGYEARVAFDAPTALRIASKFRPEVALLDLGLPVMDGYELAARLQQLPELDGVRLIALTGYAQEADRQRTRDAGFHHHFGKPVDLQALEAVLADCSSPDVSRD